MIWVYGAIVSLLILAGSSGFAFYKGYEWANGLCNAKFYKAQVTAYKRLAKKSQDALDAAKGEEEKETVIEKSNKDIVHEIEEAINKSTDNPECASDEFMRKLRNLR